MSNPPEFVSIDAEPAQTASYSPLKLCALAAIRKSVVSILKKESVDISTDTLRRSSFPRSPDNG